MKEKYEVFIGKNKQGRDKKYIVVDYASIRTKKSFGNYLDYCKKFFRCSDIHLMIAGGFVYEDGLYFENPAIPGARKVTYVYYKA